MTSDAKIGLLLGLVFIFVIAFIINGLPNLRPQTSKPEITGIMNPTAEESFSVAGNAQKAQADWTAVLEDQKSNSGAAQTATGEQSQMTIAPQATGGPEARSFLPLGSIETWLEHIATANAQQKEQQSTYVMDVPQSTAMQPPAVTEHPPAVAPARPKSAESVVPAPDIQQAARSVMASDRAGWKVYVVGEGESLASVAKKMYGAEEGNRIRNIRRIYEANKDVLKSADEVGTGQKLMIPPPLPPLPPKPEDVLSQELFQKVDAIGQKTTVKAPAKAPAPSPAPAPEGRWYVVQDGDNLWKIATNQLGSGTRYEEIAKLNADVLKNKDTLDVGMRIRLPVK
jgi:nucleoid-associated protein YgaU